MSKDGINLYSLFDGPTLRALNEQTFSRLNNWNSVKQATASRQSLAMVQMHYSGARSNTSEPSGGSGPDFSLRGLSGRVRKPGRRPRSTSTQRLSLRRARTTADVRSAECKAAEAQILHHGGLTAAGDRNLALIATWGNPSNQGTEPQAGGIISAKFFQDNTPDARFLQPALKYSF